MKKTFAQIVEEYRQHRRYILAALRLSKEKDKDET
jgi:hypothetical protein